MKCEIAQIRLCAWYDGERRGRVDELIAARMHCRFCENCRTWTGALKRQRALIQQLTRIKPSDSLKARVMDNVAAIGPIEKSVHPWPRRRIPMKIVVTTVAAALMAAAFLFGAPGRHVHGPVAAADVGKALQSVNSWHLKGFRMLDGKQALWEVWGRRNPYFYREQIGGRITTDDGKLRIQVFPPDPGYGLKRGIFVKTPSFPEEGNSPWLYEAMATKWRGMGAAKPWKNTKNRSLFRETYTANRFINETIYSVDKKTRLPIRYELRRTPGDGATFVAEELNAEYNLRIPNDIVNGPAAAEGYAIIDSTELPSSDLPKANAGSVRGITVRAEPLAIDAEGNILLALRGWIGNTPATPGSMPYLNVSAGSGERSFPPGPDAFVDDRGHSYTIASIVPLFSFNARNGDQLMLIVPVEPLRGIGDLPKRVNLNLGVRVSMASRVSGDPQMGTSKLLFGLDIPCRVVLPTKTHSIELDEFLEPNWRQRMMDPDETPTDSAIAESRARYYQSKINAAIAPAYGSDDADYSAGPKFLNRVDKSKLRYATSRTSAWSKEAVRLAPDGSRAQRMLVDSQLQMTGYGAHWMLKIGDHSGAAPVVREIVAETDKHPGVRDYWKKRALQDLKAMKSR